MLRRTLPPAALAFARSSARPLPLAARRRVVLPSRNSRGDCRAHREQARWRPVVVQMEVPTSLRGETKSERSEARAAYEKDSRQSPRSSMPIGLAAVSAISSHKGRKSGPWPRASTSGASVPHTPSPWSGDAHIKPPPNARI
jgi:hypothetical protein